MKNILGISKSYLRFFVNNINSRWVLCQGGRRSGKSFNTYKWLWLLASGQPKIVGVVAASFPALQLAINDFQRATGLVVTGNAVFGHSCKLSNGSVFMFRAFDDPTKVQGSTYDILYLEETLNIPEQVVSVLSMSVTGQIYCCYNPTKKSFLDRHIVNDKSNYLCTTFKDNDYLTEAQREEFEEIKKKALLPSASVIDRYNYSVYYKGEFGSYSGKVFKLINNISDEEYENFPAPELFGLDFGFTESEQSDATALAGVKILGDKLYAKEYIYSSNLSNNKELALRLAELGIGVYTPIVADYGGMGRKRIDALVTAEDCTWSEPQISSGFSVQNAVKGSILGGLQKLNQYEIYVTDSSVNLRTEMDNYELTAEGKPKRGCADHLIDAVRYATNSYSNNFEV